MTKMTFKERLLGWWTGVSLFAIALLYFLYSRRGRSLEETRLKVELKQYNEQVAKLLEQANKSEADHAKAFEDYLALKRRHASLLKRLGIPSD
jgi:hypothetical protein